jgi:hypothetical protein
VRGEALDHLVQRADGDQAQVRAAGCRAVGLRLELMAGPVQVATVASMSATVELAMGPG